MIIFVRQFLLVYHKIMDWLCLWTGAYYRDLDKFVQKMNERYWHQKPGFEVYPYKHMGSSLVENVVARRISLHALRAASVTFLCALPTNILVWPLMVFDILFFQREIILFAQEAYALYRPRKDYKKCRKFRFQYLDLLSIKMLEPFVVRSFKGGTGFVVRRFVIRRLAQLFRVHVRRLIVQCDKWAGVLLVQSQIEGGVNFIIVTISAAIAGMVTVWLILPMRKRVRVLLLPKNKSY